MPDRAGFGRAALCAAVICLLSIPPAVALPGTVGPLEQVSGASPFDGCTADQPGAPGGAFPPDSEVEPWIGVNPVDPAIGALLGSGSAVRIPRRQGPPPAEDDGGRQLGEVQQVVID